MQVSEVMVEIEKDRPFFVRSKGGVTFSGGECTVQSEFLLALLKECKNRSIHTAIESNGYIESIELKKLTDYTDLFLIDIKHMNSREHENATGFGNELILENIRRLVFEYKKRVSLRFPLIPGYNDSHQNIDAAVRFASEIAKSNNLDTINILPYHAFGVGKYELLGLEYTMHDTRTPKEEQITQVIQAFKKAKLPVVKGG
jgi:pyruvate formate lyase activating enzyme